jgi:hypothetical protein
MQKNDWNKSSKDALLELKSSNKRAFSVKEMISLIDYIVTKKVIIKDVLATEFNLLKNEKGRYIHQNGKSDFIETTIGYVTKAVNGSGNAPTWYRTQAKPIIYHVEIEFCSAWKKLRGL